MQIRAMNSAQARVRGGQSLRRLKCPPSRIGRAGATAAASTTASTGGLAAGDVSDRYARCGVEELLQEGELATARRSRSQLEGDHVSVLEAEMLKIADLAVLVEMG